MRTITFFLPFTIAFGAVLPSADSQRGEEIFRETRLRSLPQRSGKRRQHHCSRPGPNRGSKFHSGSAGQHHVESRTYDVVRDAAARRRCAAVIRTRCRGSLRFLLLCSVL